MKFSIVIFFVLAALAAPAQTRLIINPGGHTSLIPEAVVSHDGKLLVTVSHDKSVKIWSAEYGNIIHEFYGERGNGDEGKLYCLALSPDDRLLAVSGFLIENKGGRVNALIRIYDMQTKKLHKVLRAHTNVVNSLDFSPDGKTMASGSSDGHVVVWNTGDFSIRHDLALHRGNVRCVRFAGNGRLVSGGWDEKLAVTDAATGKTLHTSTACGKVSGICYNAKYNLLLTYADGTSYVQAWSTGLEQKARAEVYQPVGAIDTHGDFIIAGQERFPYTTSVYCYKNGQFVPATLFNGMDNSVSSCGFVDDEMAWSAGGSLNEVVFYRYSKPDDQGNISLARPIARLRGYGNSICAVGYTPPLIGFADLRCDQLYGHATLTSFFDLNSNQVYGLDKKYEYLFKRIDTVRNGYSLQHHKGGLLAYPDAVLTLSQHHQKRWSYTLDDYSGFRHTVYCFAGNQWILSGADDISVMNYQGEKRAILKGHEGAVLGLWTDSLGRYVFSSGRDQTIRLWDLSQLEDKTQYMPYEQLYESSKIFFKNRYPGLDLAAPGAMEILYGKVLHDFGEDTARYLIAPKVIEPMASFFIGSNNEWVIWTQNGYYKSSRDGARFVAYFLGRGQDQDAGYYPFEQFDLKYNRPDIINQVLGIGDSSFNASLKKAHDRRLEKMGLREEDLSGEKNLPQVNILSQSVNTEEDHFNLEFSCRDDRFYLYKLNIYNNDVPVFGSAGYPLPGKNMNRFTQKLTVPLTEGKNRISVSVVNEKGVESLREEISVFCTHRFDSRNLYIVTIGASEYRQQQYNLGYAAKDARDVAELFKQSGAFSRVFTHTVTNQEVTREAVTGIESFLSKAGANDAVIVFVAGHGVLDSRFDYYLATYDMDFSHPSEKGISYATLEQIMDRVKSLRKILFLDTCHSGEVDKDDAEADQRTLASDAGIVFRNVGTAVKHQSLGMKQTTELMKEVFTDLRKGTGAHVISSAGGYELAMEGSEWKNGLFTYVLREALQNNTADTDQNGTISIRELKAYICQAVAEKSKGVQVPTARMENISFDFRVW